MINTKDEREIRFYNNYYFSGVFRLEPNDVKFIKMLKWMENEDIIEYWFNSNICPDIIKRRIIRLQDGNTYKIFFVQDRGKDIYYYKLLGEK